LGFLAPVNKIVKKLPAGQHLVQYGVPAVAGALSLIPLYYVKDWVGPYAEQYIPAEITRYTAPISNTITGAVVAWGTRFLPFSASTKKSIALAALVTGGALDGLNYWQANGSEDIEGVFGDGTAYDLVPTMAGVEFDLSGLAVDYGDASEADAYYSGVDFDTYEGSALMAGPRGWRRAFPISKRAFRSKGGGASRHAGQRGHRWGWLIKLVGFENAQKIAAMPPQKRIALIKEIRAGALVAVEQGITNNGSEELVPVAETQGLAVNYGAMVYAGGSY